MTEVLFRWISMAAEAPHSADMAFLVTATFFTVVLLFWLGNSNPQPPKRPLLLRHRIRQ